MDEYTVIVNGIPHTMRLTEEEAKRRGAEKVTAAVSTKKSTPSNKARKTANKSAASDTETKG